MSDRETAYSRNKINKKKHQYLTTLENTRDLKLKWKASRENQKTSTWPRPPEL